MECSIVFFFFQAEDGIRDYKVTGVQTCALPIAAEAAQRPFTGRYRAASSLATRGHGRRNCSAALRWNRATSDRDRKSTRLNSSHLVISYAVFCLKKKKKCRHVDEEFIQRTL